MGVRSVIDVDVQDDRFKAFMATFEKYTKALKATKLDWEDSAVGTHAVALATAEISDELDKQRAAQRKLEEDKKKAAKEEERRTKAAAADMEKLRRTTKAIAENLASGTVSLLKWVGIGGLLSGLTGAGGLFGLDRLAASLGGARRMAGGLGINSGQQQAANLNFGRFVDANQALGGIAQAQTDQNLWAFRALGIDPSGKDAAELLAEVLPKAQRIYKPLQGKPFAEYNPQVQALQALGLSMSDLRRLGQASPDELRNAVGGYRKDSRALFMDPQVQRGWQDFERALSTAGQRLENMFGRALVKLTPVLEDLSGAVTDIIEKFVGSKGFDQLMADLKTGFEEVVKYITSDQFRSDVKQFVEDFGHVAQAIHDGLKWLGVIPKTDAEKQQDRQRFNFHGPDTGGELGNPWSMLFPSSTGGAPVSMMLGAGVLQRASYLTPLAGDISAGGAGTGAPASAGSGRVPLGIRNNNPGNIKDYRTGRFLRFGTAQEGLDAMSRQLLRYQDKYGLDTIAGIVSRWAPSSENNTGAYINDVARQTGFGARQHLNLHDPSVLAAIMRAMIQHENGINPYSRNKSGGSGGARISINNNTGGNANVQMNQGGVTV